MFSALFSLIKTVIMLCIIAVVLYSVGYVFNWLPESSAPQSLFPEGFKAFKSKLQQDSFGNSSTSDFSKWLYNYINEKEKYYDEQEAKEAADQAAEAERAKNTSSPIEKTKELMQQIEDRNKALDEL